MASAVDICNTGLSHVGARAQIASISPPDGTVEAGYCARFYPIARRELLEGAAWAFARARVALAAVSNPSAVWACAYALPSDCIKPLRVLRSSSASVLWLDYAQEGYGTAVLDEAAGAAYDVEAGVVLTNEPDAVLLYRRDIVDTSKFTPLFGNALSMLLASYLAGAIVKGDAGAKMADGLRNRAGSMAGKAAATDANGSDEQSTFVPSSILARR